MQSDGGLILWVCKVGPTLCGRRQRQPSAVYWHPAVSRTVPVPYAAAVQDAVQRAAYRATLQHSIQHATCSTHFGSTSGTRKSLNSSERNTNTNGHTRSATPCTYPDAGWRIAWKIDFLCVCFEIRVEPLEILWWPRAKVVLATNNAHPQCYL